MSSSGRLHSPHFVLVGCCLALVLVMASVTSVNLALEGIALDLGAAGSDLTWIADAYTVALAALVLPFGALGDDKGRKKCLIIGTVIFGIAAAVAATASSVGFLIACRALMGVGAALIMPATLSTVTSVYPEEGKARAVAIWAGFASAGAVLGLLMSGLLLEFFEWESTFLAVAILAAISLVGTIFFIPHTSDAEESHPDPVGAGLTAIGIGALVYVVIEGATKRTFFSIITDIALGHANPELALNPPMPEDDYSRDIYARELAFGRVNVAPMLLLEEGTQTPQPVTTAPKIEYSAKDLKRYVFVGTGRLLSLEDQGNTQQQTLYAFRDGTKSRAYGSESHETALPGGVSFPITRAKMAAVTNLLAGATADSATPMGWYYDLTGRFASVGKPAVTERIVLNLQANDGVVTWGGSILNDDPCNASGTTRLYSAYYGSGQSVLSTVVGGQRSRIEWMELSPGLADTSLVRIGSSIRVLGTDVSGGSKICGSAVAESGAPRVTNWRVIHEEPHRAGLIRPGLLNIIQGFAAVAQSVEQLIRNQ